MITSKMATKTIKQPAKTGKKRNRTGPNKSWSHEEEYDILAHIKELKENGYEFEKTTVNIYYKKILVELNLPDVVKEAQIKSKVANLRKTYTNMEDWLNQTGQGVDVGSINVDETEQQGSLSEVDELEHSHEAGNYVEKRQMLVEVIHPPDSHDSYIDNWDQIDDFVQLSENEDSTSETGHASYMRANEREITCNLVPLLKDISAEITAEEGSTPLGTNQKELLRFKRSLTAPAPKPQKTCAKLPCNASSTIIDLQQKRFEMMKSKNEMERERLEFEKQMRKEELEWRKTKAKDKKELRMKELEKEERLAQLKMDYEYKLELERMKNKNSSL